MQVRVTKITKGGDLELSIIGDDGKELSAFMISEQLPVGEAVFVSIPKNVPKT